MDSLYRINHMLPLPFCIYLPKKPNGMPSGQKRAMPLFERTSVVFPKTVLSISEFWICPLLRTFYKEKLLQSMGFAAVFYKVTPSLNMEISSKPFSSLRVCLPSATCKMQESRSSVRSLPSKTPLASKSIQFAFFTAKG